MRVAINGFGRIGRAVMRAGWSRVGIDVVHVNDVAPVEMLGYLLARDSVHGAWPHDVAVVGYPDPVLVERASRQDGCDLILLR